MMETPPFADGLGRRVPLTGAEGERLESLRLCAEIADGAATQAALVERAARYADFDHPSFARVQRVERLEGVTSGLAVVSDVPAGVRLSDVLRQAQRQGIRPDLEAALFLLRETVAATAALHRRSRDASHGALGPERIVVTPEGRPVIVEHVLAGALEQLQLSRSQLWTLFRVPVPSTAGSVRFDQQTDVLQLGVLAISLLVGRVLLRDDFPQRLPALLEEAATLDDGDQRHGSLPGSIRAWLARALQLGSRSAFRSAIDADAALAAAIGEVRACRPSAEAAAAYVARACGPAVPAAAAVRSPLPSRGAVVSVPPHGDSTVRVRDGAARGLDRGSGAHRVSSGGPASEPTSVHVLADLSQALPAVSPGDPSASVPRPRRRVSSASSRRAPQPGWAAVRRLLRRSLLVGSLVVLFGASYLGARTYLNRPVPGGTLVIESQPAGLELLVDGAPSGRTPARLQLAPGPHTLAVRNGRATTTVPVTLAAGEEKVERIEVRPVRRGPRRR